VVTMLDRKLLRDLRRMGGQVATIAVVIGCGIAILVAAVATYQSLLATQEDYYRRGRFADVFASVKRAPEALAARLAEIPGIGALETRVAEDVTITLPGAGEPLTAHIVSLPDEGTALLNRLYLREGRPIESRTTEELLVGEAFATANNLRPGGTLTAILNGRLKQLNIVGIVLSPEYVFATRPGDPIPDDARYGIMWMGRKGLASAFDMEGAFNDLTATLAPGADAPAVLDALDRRLEPYGGLIAHARRDQPSHRFLSDEIAQQGVMATTMPTVFLAVAVFLLHGMLGRLVGTQREQVAALKALGYANRAIAWHYVKFALAIVGLGGAMGLAAGLWFGHMLVENYTRFFRFPQLAFHISAWVLVLALAVSLAAGLAGALSAMRAVIVLAPAEAMRPPAPRRYHHGALERLAWVRRIPPRAQMVLRRLTDRPMRTLLTIFGIALAAPIIVMSLFWQDALDEMIGVQFATVERADLIVSFTNPLPARAEREIAGLPGVLQTEAYRVVPVQLRAGTRSYRTAITGLPPQPVLHQLVGNNLRVFPPPSDGLMLSRRLAERLALQVGERVSVEVLEGRRPHLDLTVTGLLDEMLGIGAYTTIGTVNRMMNEAGAISSVGVAAAGDTGTLRRLLSDRPNVATISERSVSLRQFRQTTEMFVLVMAGSLSLFSVMIAVGVVYNHARIALQERAWELASLRVLGFTRGEVSGLLLSELLLQLLIALPIGLYLGLWFVRGVIALHDTEMFEIPAIIHPRSYALAAIVLLLSGAASALLVRRRIDRLDLVSVLKTRE
jgi:putative ABC transport system permease protein